MADDWETYHEVDDPNADMDNDKVTNLQEYQINSDPNSNNDGDVDGMADDWETYHDVDDPNADADNDNITNLEEFNIGTHPKLNDTDNDKVNDNEDPNPLDNNDGDVDGMADDWETYHEVDDPNADMDNDKVTNLQEYQINSDPNSNNDGDVDGMADDWETYHGVEDPNSDPDNDNLTNLEEFQIGAHPRRSDTDNDRFNDNEDPNPLDNSDGDVDGMADDWETYHGVDDPNDDPDYDGLSNQREYGYRTDPHNPDTDGDKIQDGDDFRPVVNDEYYDNLIGFPDGIPDDWEFYYFQDLVLIMLLDENSDTDADGFTHEQEFLANTDPTDPDSDDDNVNDGSDPNPLMNSDSNNNGVSDDWEIYYSIINIDADPDGDKITNFQEYQIGTNPILSSDIDSDGMPDDWETYYGVDEPNADADGDMINNLQEFQQGTDPNSNYDGNNNGIADDWELYYSIIDLHADPDGDKITNIQEYQIGTNPILSNDMDNDGLPDDWETYYNIDEPFEDTDADRIINRDEFNLGLDPNTANTNPIYKAWNYENYDYDDYFAIFEDYDGSYQSLGVYFNLGETINIIRGIQYTYTSAGSLDHNVRITFQGDNHYIEYINTGIENVGNDVAIESFLCAGSTYLVANDAFVFFEGLSTSANCMSIISDDYSNGNSYFRNPSVLDSWSRDTEYEYLVELIYEKVEMLSINQEKYGAFTSLTSDQPDNIDAFIVSLDEGMEYSFNLQCLSQFGCNINMRLVTYEELTDNTLVKSSDTSFDKSMTYIPEFSGQYLLIVEANNSFVDTGIYSIIFSCESAGSSESNGFNIPGFQFFILISMISIISITLILKKWNFKRN